MKKMKRIGISIDMALVRSLLAEYHAGIKVFGEQYTLNKYVGVHISGHYLPYHLDNLIDDEEFGKSLLIHSAFAPDVEKAVFWFAQDNQGNVLWRTN